MMARPRRAKAVAGVKSHSIRLTVATNAAGHPEEMERNESDDEVVVWSTSKDFYSEHFMMLM
jgi:hypothetical protein